MSFWHLVVGLAALPLWIVSPSTLILPLLLLL
jgi:hypothetical protein